MNANAVLWIGQILLALAFLTVGYGHPLSFDKWSIRPGVTWLADVGRGRMHVVAGIETLGALGLIVPAATGILPRLTPAAAACLATLMTLAAVYHLRRPGERQNVVLNVILGVIAVLVAYGRFVVAPFVTARQNLDGGDCRLDLGNGLLGHSPARSRAAVPPPKATPGQLGKAQGRRRGRVNGTAGCPARLT